ncbi:MAG: SUMF1/EgtB/PvdO family nonheme iron enzyme, partial [Planctomycetota bacterium]
YTSEMRERDRRKHPKAGELQELEGKRDGLETELEEFNKAAKRSRTARRKVKAIEAKLPGVQEQIALLLAEIDGDRSYTFDDAEKQWQHDVVQGLGRGLERLADPKSGRLAGMRERLHQARTLRKRSVEEPTAKKAWSEAISAIRSDERYRGLELRPIEGLLPIGPEPAVRDPDSDKLLLDERSGIVLVLIPGGSFRMGAQKSDETGHNYDPQAEVDESDKDGNTVEVTLDAFFLSKYEMTQGQWQRIAGDNPSEYPPDERTWDTRQGPKPVTLLHPVENVGWLECREMLARLDLVLPTEAQWEYAARAGTDTPWWTGRDKSELAGAANLADGFCKRHGGHPSWPFDEELDDGFLILAPVGSLRPNGFGLFDVLGNVFEWCRDSTPGYGFRLPPSARVRMSRGGSWLNVAAVARSAYRGRESPTGESNKGVRPARTIRP